jgi:hypothetical protein
LGSRKRIALVDRAIARTEWPALSASFTVSMPIPLLAPMIRTVLMGSRLQLEVPELGLLMANFLNRSGSEPLKPAKSGEFGTRHLPLSISR